LFWKREVEALGLDVVKALPGYHDEDLEGKLKGVRSVRLTLGYRCYYRIVKDEVDSILVDIALVEDVNKHDYKKIERLFGE
jgi:plasmid maintenance system killer protein